MMHNSYVYSTNWLKFGPLLLLAFFLWQVGTQPTRAGGDEWTVCQLAPPDDCDFNDIDTAVNDETVLSGHTLIFTTNRETFAPFTINNKTLTLQGNNTEIAATGAGETAVTINNSSETVTMSNFTIRGGGGSNGAGILLSGGNLSLTTVSVNSNNATNSGGALYVANSGSVVTLTSVTMQSNTAANSGGAIYNNGTINGQILTLDGNTATDGAGIYNNGTATLASLSAILRNIAVNNGGGIFNTPNGNFTLEADDVASNEASNGAAVFNEGLLQVTNSNLGSSNVATEAGGGLYNSGTAALVNSAVVQNNGATGAGIYNAGTLTATNSTISRNTGTNGAGIYNINGTATLNNVTIHLTIGTSIFASGGTVAVSNTIISSVSGEAACGGSGPWQSNGYNLASDQSCTFLTAAGDLQGLNPDLNGINSPADSAAFHTPKLTSPAVNAGNPALPDSSSTACVATDQRGLARPQSNRCDIGAVEIVVYRYFLPTIVK